MLNKLLMPLCFGLSILIFIQNQDWKGWRDFYAFQDMTNDLRKIKHNKLIFGPNPILQIEKKYLNYPRVFCRLLELYEQEHAYDRIIFLTSQIRNKPDFNKWTLEEKIDLLLIAERNQSQKDLKKEISEQINKLYPYFKEI